jgi:RHS repeat-associated protein
VSLERLRTKCRYDSNAYGKGRLTGASDADHSLSWSYDALGRVLGKSQVVGGITKAVAYAYTNGRLTSMTLPSGRVVSYGYNANGQVTNLILNGNVTVLSDVLYEPFGPTRGWTWGNGTLAARTYDIDGRLTQLDSAGFSSYSYYDDGSISSRLDDTAVPYTLPSGTSSVAVASGSNRVTGTSGTLVRTYAYDAAGNVSSYGAVTFAYNFANRMKSATQAGTTTTYNYNALGQRIRKSSSGGTTLFAYDEAGHLIGEYDGSGGLIEETLWLGDTPVATLRPNGAGVDVFYVHTDHLNTPRRVSRAADNTIVWRWDSDPFGAAPANQDPDGDATPFVYNLRFPGQYYDGESGLSYNYFRDYDPATGRYLESDPIGLDGGINTYAYVGSAPTMWVDPDGLDVAVVENGPTQGNPIGHTAVAVSGAGVYSYGNATPAGSSLDAYLRYQATRRDTKVYVVKTTAAQDASALAYLRQYKNTGLPGDFLSKYFTDNCSVRSNEALDAGGVPLMSPAPYSQGPSTPPPWLPGSSGMRAISAGAAVISIPRGTTTMPPQLRQFEPH